MRNLKRSNKRNRGQISGGQIHPSLLRTQLPVVRNKNPKTTSFLWTPLTFYGSNI